MQTEKPIIRELTPKAQRLCAQKGWTFLSAIDGGATAAVFEVETDFGLSALRIYSSRYTKGKEGEIVKRRLSMVLDHLKGHECPHLVTIQGGGDVDGVVFMLMNRVPGQCLGNVLKLVPRECVRGIVKKVATAARFLEEKHLCHRDIKADNIVVSEDFENVVLLDLGVIRWLDEDGTAGTDQNGQLPFVATARYSSPEYMFRLEEPGPALWRGLTFYQLGALIHDLVMRERLFEEIVRQAVNNRYLIAHAVATQEPQVKYDGSVELELVLLAQRALSKDLSRRLAVVDWSDFLDADNRRKNEMILGLGADRSGAKSATSKSLIPDWSRKLENALDRKLASQNIHCRHRTETVAIDRATIYLAWSPAMERLPVNSEIEVCLEINEANKQTTITGSADLKSEGRSISSLNQIPIIGVTSVGEDEIPSTLLEQMYDAFLSISVKIVSKHLNEKGLE